MSVKSAPEEALVSLYVTVKENLRGPNALILIMECLYRHM